jgi:hypothetical protein
MPNRSHVAAAVVPKVPAGSAATLATGARSRLPVSYLLAAVLLVPGTGCPKRVQTVDVPRTPEGLECLRECVNHNTFCLQSYAGDTMRNTNTLLRAKCWDTQQECALRCPGAKLVEVSDAPLPCCSEIAASCGDTRCTCDPSRCSR